MPPRLFRVVLDTNILVRGLLHERSASGRILRACDVRAVVPLVSKPVLAEYRSILTDPDLLERYPQLEDFKVKSALRRLTYMADVVRAVKARFNLPRDPKDAKLIELAISGQATHLITTDRDLLDLADGHDGPANRLRRRRPSFKIIKPDEFLAAFGEEVNQR